MEAVDDLVVSVITSFLQIERKHIRCYLFDKEVKRKVLKEVTKFAGMFNGLGVANIYNDIVDKNKVDGFWTATGSTK